jgi:prepilin-type N-terminal cleavage/methylation domain-containing protein
MMKSLKQNETGFSLLELLVVIGIIGVVLAVILSTYSTVVKQMATTRKMVKTEADLVNTVYPIFKEIESAGFGVPSNGGACQPAIKLNGAEVVIHSTGAGDEATSGLWSQISGSNCAVNLPSGTNVVVIDPVGKKRVQMDTVGGGVLSSCSGSWQYMLAYAIPSSGALECYETAYSLRAYAAADNPKPAICATGTQRFSRSVDVNADSRQWNGMLDCVLDARYVFGCVNKFTGAVTWRSDTNCNDDSGDLLRFLRMALIVQDSPKQDTQVAPAEYKLFSDTNLAVTISMTANPKLRLYRWRIIEKTIVLRNLE